jgi:hypothetical protein
MRVLVVHPEDELQTEPWGSLRWDRVIDFGKTGEESDAEAAARFGCRISRLDEFRSHFQEMCRVRELLALGMGRLNDSLGLDWWGLTSILIHQQLELAFLLGMLANTIQLRDEVHVTRPGFHADALRLALGSRVYTFAASTNNSKRSAGHYVRMLKKFPVPQLLEFFWDKTDPGYQFRGVFRRHTRCSTPVVLLPSSYINVSRAAINYAESLPDMRFLLVATRRSGWIENRPPNVSGRWLSQYASLNAPSRKLEYQDLVQRWELVRSELKTVPEVRTLDVLGCFDEFPLRFARGLEIRDAWRNVFTFESVQAVICADDTNPYTHLPLLLAVQKKLPTISCHHGALDGRYMFKRNHADVLLAKGKMEEDYLVRLCRIRPEAVEIGAPTLREKVQRGAGGREKRSIVFFSEAYEVAGGRARGFYRDTLPPLANLALSEHRELIIKLHPSESVSDRTRLVRETLNSTQQRVVRVVGGPLQQGLLDQAWCGVTVMSTVVIECALQQIPCFLCAWLESWPYGYCDQFARFEVGIRLREPAEIQKIPAILQGYHASSAIRQNCWTPIPSQRLQALLGLGRHQPTIVGARD